MFENLLENCRKTFKLNTKDVIVNGKQNGQFNETDPEELDASENGMKLTDKEYKAAIITLSFSLSVLCGKLIFGNKDTLHAVYLRRKNLQYTIPASLPMWLAGVVSSVQHAWVDLSWILVPLLWCVFLTLYAWLVVYKNIRHIPGRDTPSPMTPSRYKQVTGRTFYLDYWLPVVISCCGFVMMLSLSHLAA